MSVNRKQLKYGGIFFLLAVTIAIAAPIYFAPADNAYKPPVITELSRSDLSWVNEQISPFCQGAPTEKATVYTAPGTKEQEVPIILYHRVTNNDAPSHEVIPTWQFKDHMTWLKKEGYNTISVATLTDYMNKVPGVTLPPKPIVITFDDGWKDNMEASKVLKDLDFGATWYIISGFFKSDMYMGEDDIKELAKNPKFEIGSHSHTHFTAYEKQIDKLDLCTMARETFGSKRILERILHKPVKSIAWPYGHFTHEAVYVAEKAGYTSTMLTSRDSKNVPGNTPLYTRRLNVDGSCPIEKFQEMVKTNELKECNQ